MIMSAWYFLYKFEISAFTATRMALAQFLISMCVCIPVFKACIPVFKACSLNWEKISYRSCASLRARFEPSPQMVRWKECLCVLILNTCLGRAIVVDLNSHPRRWLTDQDK